jgi:hypothetical protein
MHCCFDFGSLWYTQASSLVAVLLGNCPIGLMLLLHKMAHAIILCSLCSGISIRRNYLAHSFFYPRLFRIVFSVSKPVSTILCNSCVLMHQALQIFRSTLSSFVAIIAEEGRTWSGQLYVCNWGFWSSYWIYSARKEVTVWRLKRNEVFWGNCCKLVCRAPGLTMPWLRWLVATFSLWRPGIMPGQSMK